MRRENKVVRIDFAGGLIGLLFGRSRGKIERAVSKHNNDGWKVAEVIQDNPNLAIVLFRTVILFLTLGLWTISSGYLFILERPVQA
ncbi:MAG: hypothetical protein GY883_16020 [Shimia sp.]|nr:hypothetical protein [Shimia sp.]